LLPACWLLIGWMQLKEVNKEVKTKKEILEYYGKCCVSEYCLTENRKYPDNEAGKAMAKKDDVKIEDIRGQKKAIEFIFG